MSGWGLKSLVLAGLVLAAFAVGASSSSAALPDASCPGPPSSGVGPGPTQRYAQTFTALHTGTVVRAQTEISKTAPGSDFQLQILTANASGPINGILGAATIPDASVPSGPSTLSGAFGSPPRVVAGQQYALVIFRPGAGYTLRDRGGDPCPGQEFFSQSEAGTWSPEDPGYDFVYSVFVNPPNDFTIGKLKGRKLLLTVPGPGAVAVANAGGAGKSALASAKKLLKTSTATVTAAGTATVKLKLTKLAKRLLARRGKLKVKAAVTFTPTGGDPNTVTKRLKLKK